MRRTRFQQGSLQIVKRARGRHAWEYRWYELQADGTRKRRCLILGSLEQYPIETAAQKAVAALRADINAENPRTSLTPISVQTLIEHYREKELGPNCSKTRKTQVTYEGYFNKWILPRWGAIASPTLRQSPWSSGFVRCRMQTGARRRFETSSVRSSITQSDGNGSIQ